MPFRRRSRKNSKKNRARAAFCEHLESRTLLTALINGRFQGTNTIYDGQSYFIYRQANGNANVKISVVGNVTAEFIGGRGGLATDTFVSDDVVISDLLPDTAPAFVAATGLNASTFLFSIYIVSADVNSAISIAVVPTRPVPPADPIPRPMQPFGAGTLIRFNPSSADATQPAGTQTVTPTDGGVYIGSQSDSGLTAPANNIPRIFSSTRAFGLRPSAAGPMYAGIQTAAGVSIGKIFVGGTVTGRVDIEGSIGTFYAGNILTGDAAGIGATQSTETFLDITNNFHVGGDIQNLLSANSFGTISLNNLVTAGDFTTFTYKTGFQLDVNGRVGQVFGNDSFLGSVQIRNLTSVTGTGLPQREIESIGGTITNNSFTGPGLSSDAWFDPEFHGLDISIGGTVQDARFTNNTFDSPQYLGSFRSADLRQDNIIQVKGTLQNNTVVGALTVSPDPLDFYAVSLLAGQVIYVQLDDGLGLGTDDFHTHLAVVDPRGRIIATDYSNRDRDSRVNLAVSIKAEIPGTYRFVVGHVGDFNFNGVRDAGAEFNSIFNTVKPYTLTIANAGNMGLGALVVNQHIGTMDASNIGIEVQRGDVGAIHAGMGATVDGRTVTPAEGNGEIFSESSPWYIPVGHLRVMEAFSLGISGTALLQGTGPDVLVRKGSIGLLRTTGATLSNTLALNDDATTSDGVTPLFPLASSDLSRTGSWLAVGEDIQVIDCAGVLVGDYLANGAIGTIRAQQIGGISLTAAGAGNGTFGTLANYVGDDVVIQTNVDTIGSDGVIDLIDATPLTAGATSVYYLAISTGPNGNLRYFHVGNGGVIRQDRFFGGGIVVTPTLYAPGEQATYFDDSGARIVLTPIPRVPGTLFPRPINALSDFLDPPQLSVMTYPIRGKSGVALVRVTVVQNNDPFSDGVTDINRPGGGGMQVDVSSANSRSGAEIGEIDISTTPATSTSNTITFNPFTSTTGGITANLLAPPRAYVETAPPTDPTLVVRPLDLIFQGNVPADVYNILATAAQTIHSIDNKTTGEIVNVTGTPDVESFSAQTIGIPRSSTGALVEGRTQRIANTFPFTDQRNLIDLSDVALIRARGAIGNVQATNIGNIQANYDGKNTTGTFEGIAAPIFSVGTNQTTGNIVRADIGEGIATSGTGGVPVAAAGGAVAGLTGLIRSGLFANGIIDTVTGRGDIRGDIVSTATTAFVQQQATDATGNGLINSDGTALQINTPRSIIGSIRLNGGSIIDADILVATTLDQSVEGVGSGSTLYTTTELGLTPPETITDPQFDIESIRLDGNGGIIGSFIFAGDVGQITVNGGFGVMSSEILAVADGTVQGITTDGFGVRNDVLNVGGTLNSVVARGTGGRVATTAYSASVRQSEAAAFDAYTGLQLDPYNDLHQLLGTSSRRPVVVGTSETGMIVDSIFTGSRDLKNVEAFRILGKNVFATDANGRTARIPFGSTDYPMRFNFANLTTNVHVTDVVNGLSLTTGRMKNFYAGNDVIYTALNVGTSLENFYAGAFRGTSSLKMTTVAGTVQNFRTKRSLYGAIVISQDILNLTVGTDIGSPLIYASRNINSLNVKGSLLTGTHITARRVLKSMVIGGDIRQGATVRAGSIGKQKIGGQVLGDILII